MKIGYRTIKDIKKDIAKTYSDLGKFLFELDRMLSKIPIKIPKKFVFKKSNGEKIVLYKKTKNN